MARITVYKDGDFQGESKDFTGAAYVGKNFNDTISSFIVHDGNWQFYKDADAENPVGRVFNAGEKVNWVEAVGISNDSISSLQPV
jgi:hypothetical protein